MGDLEYGEDDDIGPKVAIETRVVLCFEKPAAQENDKGHGEHFYRLVEEGVGGVPDQQEHGQPVHPWGVDTFHRRCGNGGSGSDRWREGYFMVEGQRHGWVRGGVYGDSIG